METRHNKPRVFLSHSKVDIAFIEKVYNDLRACQIEPWLDSEEIRHGHPWLQSIFEDGIPTCDAVLAYLSEASLESKMVTKEIDAGIIGQLSDKNIAFLPYVKNIEVRKRLRSDIQALQMPVWNNDNYYQLLVKVVAEIWRSYLEKTITVAVQSEKVKRLQAELQLERVNKKELSSGIFTPSEDAEFKYIV